MVADKPLISRESPALRRHILAVTENWVYPQVVGVPSVNSAVFCRATANLAAFPPGSAKLLASPPPRHQLLGVPWFLNALAGRAGWRDAGAELWARCWRPDLLHAHFGTRAWESLRLRRRLDVPMVTSFYGFDAWMMPVQHPVWLDHYRELFAEGSVFLVEGAAMRQRLIALGCPPEKIRIHRIGVDLTTLPYSGRDFSTGLRILMMGRFVEKKGLVDGLRACAFARARNVDLDVTVIGDAAPQSETGQRIKAELHELARQPGLAGRVTFAGLIPLDQARAALKTHNVLLCPSRHAADGDAEGGFPVVITEAMASGLFCIGTRHCDIPEIIRDHQTGRLCDEADTTAMGEILRSSPEDPATLVQLTKAGRRHVEAEFSLQLQMERLRAIYAQI